MTPEIYSKIWIAFILSIAYLKVYFYLIYLCMKIFKLFFSQHSSGMDFRFSKQDTIHYTLKLHYCKIHYK